MKIAPALHVHGDVSGVEGVRLVKVVTAEEAAQDQHAWRDLLIWDAVVEGTAGSIWSGSPQANSAIQVSNLRHADVIRPGDVIRLRQGGSLISVLYRRGSLANSLFVTEQCNSLCLMCSQPPNPKNDRWRLPELHSLIDLIDGDEGQLGISGGEPTLLGEELSSLIKHARLRLPNTHLHVLTNGRLFGHENSAASWVGAGGDQTVWAVPLYADVASVHDMIVDSPNAFDETLDGLYQLARRGARVEIRVVLHALSIPRLARLAALIYRRMPFVEHVALMGLEPMGFAKTNRDRLWIDPVDYQAELADAVHFMATRGLSVSIYNLPLCTLPRELWSFARQSISEWKNRDLPECAQCSLKHRCSGFFASAGPQWRSRAVAPICDIDDVLEPGERQHELA